MDFTLSLMFVIVLAQLAELGLGIPARILAGVLVAGGFCLALQATARFATRR